ncbi:MAG: holo-ACP synthase [Ignavibacteriales bacterium]
MIFGIGIDIIEITRIEQSIEKFGDSFLNKIFTQTEINYCKDKPNKYQHFAARFAGKEAVAKALSSIAPNGFNWKDIEIYNKSNGQPEVKLFGSLAELLTDEKGLKLTMSHSENYVSCFAIIYKIDNRK